eukprot:365184-Chlamydomonas_euryale.AAC.7
MGRMAGPMQCWHAAKVWRAWQITAGLGESPPCSEPTECPTTRLCRDWTRRAPSHTRPRHPSTLKLYARMRCCLGRLALPSTLPIVTGRQTPAAGAAVLPRRRLLTRGRRCNRRSGCMRRASDLRHAASTMRQMDGPTIPSGLEIADAHCHAQDDGNAAALLPRVHAGRMAVMGTRDDDWDAVSRLHAEYPEKAPHQASTDACCSKPCGLRRCNSPLGGQPLGCVWQAPSGTLQLSFDQVETGGRSCHGAIDALSKLPDLDACGFCHTYGTPLPPHSSIFTLFTGFFGRNKFHIFCRQISIIAKSVITKAYTWINITPRLPVSN